MNYIGPWRINMVHDYNKVWPAVLVRSIPLSSRSHVQDHLPSQSYLLVQLHSEVWEKLDYQLREVDIHHQRQTKTHSSEHTLVMNIIPIEYLCFIIPCVGYTIKASTIRCCYITRISGVDTTSSLLWLRQNRYHWYCSLYGMDLQVVCSQVPGEGSIVVIAATYYV